MQYTVLLCVFFFFLKKKVLGRAHLTSCGSDATGKSRRAECSARAVRSREWQAVEERPHDAALEPSPCRSPFLNVTG